MMEYCDLTSLREWYEHESWAQAQAKEELSAVRAQTQFGEALATARVTVQPLTEPLKERFRELAENWDQETRYLSSPTQRMEHPSYQAILGLGRENKAEIVCLLISDMQQNERPWFWALSYLTGENPISRVDAGRMDKMIASWTTWAKNKGLL
jgi:hypothetical protein